MHSINRVGLSVALIFSVISLVAGAAIANAFAGQTTRVSVSSAGDAASAGATFGALSADGRYVVFQSSATDLVAGVSGTHVYRHDRTTGTTALVDVASSGGTSSGPALQPTVSANGRYVAFVSFASDLVDVVTTAAPDVFVRDMQLGVTTLVSANSSGQPSALGGSLSSLPAARQISDDGLHVVFTSTATNLVAELNNGQRHVYVKDLTSGEVVRASVNDAGDSANQSSQTATISGNGRVVAFQSGSTNLSTASDTPQIFVRDLVAGTTTLESPGAAAVGAVSTAPALSFDGRYLAFESKGVLDPRDLDNGTLDIYLRDRAAPGSTVLVSLSNNTNTGLMGASSIHPSISGDGRWVAFASQDDMLVTGDANNAYDVFLYDRTTEGLALVSRNDTDEQADADSFNPSVSSNGNLVLFGSTATNLVASPSNVLTNQLYVRILEEEQAPPSPVTIEWLSHLSDGFTVGRNLPVKFIVRDEDGAPVFDQSVRVDVVDLSGDVVAGPYLYGNSPSRSVTWNGEMYHVNVDTKDVEAGMYRLRVRFSSPALTVEFTRETNGTAGAVRHRLRD
jgi:Tol biopolymer transport system component